MLLSRLWVWGVGCASLVAAGRPQTSISSLPIASLDRRDALSLGTAHVPLLMARLRGGDDPERPPGLGERVEGDQNRKSAAASKPSVAVTGAGVPKALMAVSAFTAIAAQSLSSLAAAMTPNQHVLSSYAWTLVGTSLVWYLFFYLLSVGYATGIGLPVVMAMFQHRRATPQSILLVLWSLRLAGFLLWREYVTWPAWHQRMQQVARRQRQNMPQHALVTLGSWLVYSAIYLAMAWPVLGRLYSTTTTTANPPFVPPSLSLTLQCLGLGLETVADWQKAQWKRQKPHAWCYTGLWRYSTHPNYLGEWIFWCGTFASGLTKPPVGSSQNKVAWVVSTLFMTLGFCFISTVLQGAVTTLNAAQYTRYANNPVYLDFGTRTTVWGPRYRQQWNEWWNARHDRRLLQQAKIKEADVLQVVSNVNATIPDTNTTIPMSESRVKGATS